MVLERCSHCGGGFVVRERDGYRTYVNCSFKMSSRIWSSLGMSVISANIFGSLPQVRQASYESSLP